MTTSKIGMCVLFKNLSYARHETSEIILNNSYFYYLMHFNTFLEEACDSIKKNFLEFQKNSEKLVPLKEKISPNGKENFAVKIFPKEISSKIAGIDSGFVSKKISMMDLVLIRTAGVIFEYENSILKKADYFPAPVLLPEPVLLKNFLEKDEEQQSISLQRLRKELDLSIKIICEQKPDYLFIDGSIIPQYQDKPRDNSSINKEYTSIIDLFQKLYSVADENSCTLISVVEDSRGRRFNSVVEDFTGINLKNSSDSFTVNYFLSKGERTFFFPYSSEIEKHAVLNDYNKKWSENIFVFYLKASNEDFPLRVEFISNKPFEKVDDIASIVFSLSSIDKNYSYPSVLIEADLRARLNDDDISMVYNKLIDKLGPKMSLRRNSRPF